MTTEAHADSADTPDEGDGAEDSELVRSLRQQNKDLKKALDSTTPIVRRQALEDAGFKDGTPHGKLLTEVADARKLAPTPENFKTLAEEFGLSGSGEGTTTQPGPTEGAETGGDSQVQSETDGADETMQAGNEVPAVADREALLAKIDEAQAAGDTFTVVHLQRQLSDVPK